MRSNQINKTLQGILRNETTQITMALWVLMDKNRIITNNSKLKHHCKKISTVMAALPFCGFEDPKLEKQYRNIWLWDLMTEKARTIWNNLWNKITISHSPLPLFIQVKQRLKWKNGSRTSVFLGNQEHVFNNNDREKLWIDQSFRLFNKYWASLGHLDQGWMLGIEECKRQMFWLWG